VDTDVPLPGDRVAFGRFAENISVPYIGYFRSIIKGTIQKLSILRD
jgi:hypothetical protein